MCLLDSITQFTFTYIHVHVFNLYILLSKSNICEPMPCKVQTLALPRHGMVFSVQFWVILAEQIVSCLGTVGITTAGNMVIMYLKS